MEAAYAPPQLNYPVVPVSNEQLSSMMQNGFSYPQMQSTEYTVPAMAMPVTQPSQSTLLRNNQKQSMVKRAMQEQNVIKPMKVANNSHPSTVKYDLNEKVFPSYKIGIPAPLPLKSSKKVSLVNVPASMPRVFIP